MPNVTLSSLKRKNDSLKDEIAAAKRNLEELQQSIKRQDPQTACNGAEQPTRLITDAESLSTLEFYGKSYDDLRAESVNSFKQLWSCLNPGGVTWVNFCWVCAAGLSEPLPHYSLFCGRL